MLLDIAPPFLPSKSVIDMLFISLKGFEDTFRGGILLESKDKNIDFHRYISS